MQAEAPETRSRWPARIELLTGLGMAATGIWQSLVELPSSVVELRPTAHHGIALVGVFLTLRAIAELFLSVHRGGAAIAMHDARVRFRDLIASPAVESLIGVLVLVASFGQIVVVASSQAPAMWHWGFLLVGLTMVCRAGYTAYEGFERLHHHALPAWLRPLAAFFARPAFQLVLAVGILVLCLFEIVMPAAFVTEAAGEGGKPVAPGAHAAAGFAIARILQCGRDLWSAYTLIQAVRQQREHGGHAA